VPVFDPAIFDPAVFDTVARLDLAATMDALAGATPAGISHAWPVESITPPCWVVGYPEDIDFDAVFARGSDKATFPMFYIVGKVTTKTARDMLSAVISGVDELKAAIEADPTLGAVIQTCRVTHCRPQEITVAGVAYLSARFDVEVYS
jgi:hypothetical protein